MVFSFAYTPLLPGNLCLLTITTHTYTKIGITFLYLNRFCLNLKWTVTWNVRISFWYGSWWNTLLDVVQHGRNCRHILFASSSLLSKLCSTCWEIICCWRLQSSPSCAPSCPQITCPVEPAVEHLVLVGFCYWCHQLLQLMVVGQVPGVCISVGCWGVISCTLYRHWIMHYL
jgi:hypothetical protein